ncbi:MAG: hypothetical protein R3A46_08590 [Thermomicrobiales bacterium]
MIAALITFDVETPLSLEEATEKFESTAPNYRGLAHLISKSYIRSQDGGTVGGFYVWDSREAAEEMYAGEWEDKVTGVYGVKPTLQYFDVPVLIQNDPSAGQ